LAETILGKHDPLVTRGFGKPELPCGPYDDHHKFLRKIWLQTQNRIFGKNRIQQIIDESCSRLIKMFNEVNGAGIDPETIFMSSTVNVISGVAIGRIFDLEDPELRQLCKFQRISKVFSPIYRAYGWPNY